MNKDFRAFLARARTHAYIYTLKRTLIRPIMNYKELEQQFKKWLTDGFKKTNHKLNLKLRVYKSYKDFIGINTNDIIHLMYAMRISLDYTGFEDNEEYEYYIDVSAIETFICISCTAVRSNGESISYSTISRFIDGIPFYFNGKTDFRTSIDLLKAYKTQLENHLPILNKIIKN